MVRTVGIVAARSAGETGTVVPGKAAPGACCHKAVILYQPFNDVFWYGMLHSAGGRICFVFLNTENMHEKMPEGLMATDDFLGLCVSFVGEGDEIIRRIVDQFHRPEITQGAGYR